MYLCTFIITISFGVNSLMRLLQDGFETRTNKDIENMTKQSLKSQAFPHKKKPFLYYTWGNITRTIINIYYRNSQTFLSIVLLSKRIMWPISLDFWSSFSYTWSILSLHKRLLRLSTILALAKKSGGKYINWITGTCSPYVHLVTLKRVESVELRVYTGS